MYPLPVPKWQEDFAQYVCPLRDGEDRGEKDEAQSDRNDPAQQDAHGRKNTLPRRYYIGIAVTCFGPCPLYF